MTTDPKWLAPFSIWDVRRNRFYRPIVQTRDNPLWRNQQSKRYTQATIHEGIYKYVEIAKSCYTAYTKKLRRYNMPYKSFPTSQDSVIILSDNSDVVLSQNGVVNFDYLPMDRHETARLILDWITDIPKNAHGQYRRVTGTHDYGGEFAGCRHKNKPGDYIKVDAELTQLYTIFDALPKFSAAATLDQSAFQIVDTTTTITEDIKNVLIACDFIPDI